MKAKIVLGLALILGFYAYTLYAQRPPKGVTATTIQTVSTYQYFLLERTTEDEFRHCIVTVRGETVYFQIDGSPASAMSGAINQINTMGWTVQSITFIEKVNGVYYYDILAYQ